MEECLVIGIAGGSASGKTTVVKKLQEYFQDAITVISHDSYYKAHNDMPYEERCKLNYDHPDAFETERMIRDVLQLKNHQSVQVPVYDYSIHNRSEETEVLEPRKIIILEGILLFHEKALRDVMDIKIFVDAAADIRLMRRIRRDTVERARSVDSILDQYESTVRRMHELYVEPTKVYADLIIPSGIDSSIGVSILIDFFEMRMKNNGQLNSIVKCEF